MLANTRAIGATAVNEARLDFTRVASVSNQPTDSPVSLSSLGFVTGPGTLGIISSGPDNWQSVPPISLSGQVNFNFGRNISATGQFNNTWHASESFSKIWNKHAFKFGGEYRYLQINERNIYAPNGNFSFDGSETGHDVADLLLGAPAQYIQAAVQVLDSRTQYGAAFAQYSWRVAPNFMLNLGLRWEVSMPWYDTQNKIETIVPGVQSTVLPGAPKGWLVPAARESTTGISVRQPQRQFHQRQLRPGDQRQGGPHRPDEPEVPVVRAREWASCDPVVILRRDC